MSKTILITGASGLIGKRLTEILLEKGYAVRHLTRKKNDLQFVSPVSQFIWNIEKKELDVSAFENTDAIIHLAGTNLYERRWNTAVKKNIYDSRIKGTESLVRALSFAPNKVKSIVSASGIGYYGDRKNEVLSEDAPPANTFLAGVCADWENEVRKAEEQNIRTVQMRTGIVLAKNSGALKELSTQLKLFIRPIFLPGTQAWSWIHLDDVCNFFIHAIENENMRGAYNATAPDVVSYSEFINTFADVMKKKTIPAPAMRWMVKIIVGEFGDALFHNCNCSSEKTLASGFQFQYPDLKRAMEDLHYK